jgi:hypothetical protein
MAVSLAFGILFATIITLVLVPTILMIADDIARYFKSRVSEIGGAVAAE